MAQQQGPAPTRTFPIGTLPGIKRDGTVLDGQSYQDGQWVRFQRGRPKKMGGYRAMTTVALGPIRNVLVDSRLGTNTLHMFSQWGVEQLAFDSSGAGGAVVDRTPAGFSTNTNYSWQSDRMYSSTGGVYTAVLAAATPDLADIASDTTGPVYQGDITAGSALTAVADGAGDLAVSGGLVVLQPFLFVYGSAGLIRNSTANNYTAASGWKNSAAPGLYANDANVAGTKVVKGLPLRGGGNSPAGLFWALDALIRVSFVGGTALWKYDTLSAATSVMSKSGIIEYDGLYYWPGVDRFFVYNGVVQELPNQMNVNWFFDNLNYAQRQKVWALKIPRYGEIWWFYPRGSATECTHAVCYNVREQTWYDCEWARSAGQQVQVFTSPILTGGEDEASTAMMPTTPVSGSIVAGNTVTGGTSGASGTVLRTLGTKLNVQMTSGSFLNGETLTSGGGATATVGAAPTTQLMVPVWQHEFGYDKVVGGSSFAISSFVQTSNFSYITGGPVGAEDWVNFQSRMVRMEPDMILTGEMSFTVEGKDFANSDILVSSPYPFTNTTEYVDTREQRREMSLTFTSNVAGGFYEFGKIIVTIEPGDARGD